MSAFLSLMVVIPTATLAQIEDVVPCVAYLRQEVIKTEQVDGRTYQLYLRVPGTDESRPWTTAHTGSGMFLGVGDQLYLVTARHVAEKMRADALAVVEGPGNNPIPITLGDLTDGPENVRWVAHSHADVSVLPIVSKKREILKILERHFLPIAAIVTEETAPSRRTVLTTLGFPLGLGIEGKFSPISRTSKPASGLIKLKRYDTRELATFFLLEDPSIGGFSGAPVFDVQTVRISERGIAIGRPGLRCYGIVHATLSDETGGKLAAITPGKYILETMEKAKTEVWKVEKTDVVTEKNNSNEE